MKPDYSVFIIWSKKDEAFLAQVPELPGCIADGPTHEEALSNAKAAIQKFIERARAAGREIPEPNDLSWFALQPYWHALTQYKFTHLPRSHQDAYIKKLSEYWDSIP